MLLFTFISENDYALFPLNVAVVKHMLVTTNNHIKGVFHQESNTIINRSTKKHTGIKGRKKDHRNITS